MTDKYKFFAVEGIIVGWLDTSDDENDCIMEHDVAIVQNDDGRSYIRWLGNDWEQIDTLPQGERAEQVAAIGTRIRFMTNVSEQREYTKLAHGKE